MTTKPEAITLIEAALAAGPTDGPWISAGPSFGAALPKYLNEVVVNREGDDTYLVCVCPLGLDGDQESSVTIDYISIVNPTAMREVLAHIAAQDAEIARLREKHEQEVENILDDAQEWAVYVIEDSAPCSLRHRLVDEINQRAALAATKKDPL